VVKQFTLWLALAVVGAAVDAVRTASCVSFERTAVSQVHTTCTCALVCVIIAVKCIYQWLLCFPRCAPVAVVFNLMSGGVLHQLMAEHSSKACQQGLVGFGVLCLVEELECCSEDMAFLALPHSSWCDVEGHGLLVPAAGKYWLDLLVQCIVDVWLSVSNTLNVVQHRLADIAACCKACNM